MNFGLFPKYPEKLEIVGNAAGDGAAMALFEDGFIDEMEKQVKKVHHVELAGEKDFQKKFMNAMELKSGIIISEINITIKDGGAKAILSLYSMNIKQIKKGSILKKCCGKWRANMRLVFIGAGNMAQAMIGGILAKEIVKKEDIIASAATQKTIYKVAKEFGINVTLDK